MGGVISCTDRCADRWMHFTDANYTSLDSHNIHIETSKLNPQQWSESLTIVMLEVGATFHSSQMCPI